MEMNQKLFDECTSQYKADQAEWVWRTLYVMTLDSIVQNSVRSWLLTLAITSKHNQFIIRGQGSVRLENTNVNRFLWELSRYELSLVLMFVRGKGLEGAGATLEAKFDVLSRPVPWFVSGIGDFVSKLTEECCWHMHEKVYFLGGCSLAESLHCLDVSVMLWGPSWGRI